MNAGDLSAAMFAVEENAELLKGEKGTKGDIGLVGPQGPQGDVGPEGPQGERGDFGPQGIMGLTGPKGDKGDLGDPGKDGLDGKRGDPGKPGRDGERGLAGPVGPSGKGGGVQVVARGGSGSSLAVKDEGATIDTAVTSIDFAGAGVTATNVGHAVTVTVAGGGGGGGATVTVSDVDPGAIGPLNFWLETTEGPDPVGNYNRLWLRNATDDDWAIASPVSYADSGQTLLTSPGDSAELNLLDGAGSYIAASTDLKIGLNGGAGVKGSLFLDTDGIHLGPTNAGPLFTFGSVDPSAGGGVVAALGSMYIKTDGLVFWKTAAPDTGWTSLPLNALAHYLSTVAVDISGTDLTFLASTGNLNLNANTNIMMTTLPTSDPGVSGALWNNLGVVMVSP